MFITTKMFRIENNQNISNFYDISAYLSINYLSIFFFTF